MTKVIEQKEVGEMLTYIVEHMATKEDLREQLTEGLHSLRSELKADLFGLQTQVNSIENQLKGMQYGRLEMRVADLEEKVFGEQRS